MPQWVLRMRACSRLCAQTFDCGSLARVHSCCRVGRPPGWLDCGILLDQLLHMPCSSTLVEPEAQMLLGGSAVEFFAGT
jgi:hypothetical protein